VGGAGSGSRSRLRSGHERRIRAPRRRGSGDHHKRLTFKFEGLDQKLTGTTPAKVITGLLA
jgi:hypothetical protein